ncbi:MAG: protein kinase [Polyangiales bacterium]
MPASTAPSLAVIAGRYKVIEQLGRGGMAVVYRVQDLTSDRIVALKRLLPQDTPDSHVSLLFQREYETLSQLVHPRIIDVYHYQTDEFGPFYTMELLSGGDLRQRAPVPWRDACRLLCDICSALALLHSRRFVHRDLTPLNVRCTADGHAKLFDFGSMTQFGRTKHVVGTPPFVAPEALHGQIIDGQADLFSLGATLYYALTGRHAYPARALADLPDLWRAVPPPPSQVVPGIPPALDDLVLELLQLTAANRPPSAADVMERLSAIGELTLDEALLVGQAYLSTPNLVGREEARAITLRRLQRVRDGQGTSLLVSGAPGTGRSRFLDVCVLEAKLAGAFVLRADARDATGRSWAVARALLGQLISQAPDLAGALLTPHRSALAPFVSERNLLRSSRPPAAARSSQASLPPARSGVPAPASDGPTQRSITPEAAVGRSELQTALQAVFLELAKRRLLVIAVDDVDRIDEPSAALLSLLANHAREQRLVVITTLENKAAQGSSAALSLQLLESFSDAIRLRDLSRAHTQQLVLSLFGDVPNARWLAERIFAVTYGNPARVMQVAQHLVQQGLCHYAAGHWSLPQSLPPDELSHALRESLPNNLSASALELARAVALLGSREPVDTNDALLLTSHGDSQRLQVDLLSLASAGIFAMEDSAIMLSRPSLTRLLLQDLDEAGRRALHLRLVAFLSQREGRELPCIQHLVAAGELATAFDRLAAHQKTLRAKHLEDPGALFEHLQTVPPEWPAIYHTLIRAGRELGRPRIEVLLLEMSLVAYAVLTARVERELVLEIFAQLRHDTGLDLIDAMRATTPPGELLGRALTAAQERYNALPENERGLSVLDAIPALPQVITQAIGMAARTFDRELLVAAPSLTPLAALSPALAVVQRNLEGSIAYLSGRLHRARDAYQEIVERVDQPDGAGLSGSLHRHLRLAVIWAIGTVDASFGRPYALTCADLVEGDPLFLVSSHRLRGSHALMRGDYREAEAQRQKTEVLQIQNAPPQVFDGTPAMHWTIGYFAIGDLLRVKHCLREVEALAREYPGWRAVMHYGRGAYQALRGDHVHALAELDRALALVVPGEHPVWLNASAASLWSLTSLRRWSDAVERGLGNLADVERTDLGPMGSAVLVPLALAESALGQLPAALEHIERAITYLAADSGSGVSLGTAYEVRARIALAAGDAATFTDYAARCAEQFAIGGHGALVARHAKLLRAGRKVGLVPPDPNELLEQTELDEADARATVSTVLGTAHGPEERAERALELLGRFARCNAGYLYVLQHGGPVLVAQLGAAPTATDLDRLVGRLLQQANEDNEDMTQTEAGEVLLWTAIEGGRYLPMLLSHTGERGMLVTGAAIMWVTLDQPAPRVPTRLLEALSKALYDAGDALTQLSDALTNETQDDEADDD